MRRSPSEERTLVDVLSRRINRCSALPRLRNDPPALQTRGLLRNPNVLAAGGGLAAVTGAILSAVLGTATLSSIYSSIFATASTFILGVVWALLLRRCKNGGHSALRWSRLASVPLAALNGDFAGAGLCWKEEANNLVETMGWRPEGDEFTARFDGHFARVKGRVWLMRFLHAADIHLDSPLAGLRQRGGARGDELAGATRRAFQNLVQFAIEQKVELLLIAGDNYDGRHRHYGSVLFFAREMCRLQRAGIRVVMIRGNHDAENQMELRLAPGIHLLSPDQPESIDFDDLGVVVHGQSYPRRDVRHNLVTTYPDPVAGRVNIGLLHTAVDGFCGTHERYAPCTVADLIAKNYEYWALGHVHERVEISKAPWIVYSGNLQARHVNEAGSKGATLATVTGGRISDVKALSFDVARWTRLRIDISSCEGIDEVSVALDAALATAVDDADGRTLVARLEIIGLTQLHRALKADTARLDAEAERAAEAAGDVWIEQIRLMTEDALDDHPTSAGALAGLLHGVETIRTNAASRELLRETVGALPRKMPVTLRREIGLETVDDETLDHVIDDARDVLLGKLTGGPCG